MSRVKLQTSLGNIVLELDAAKAPGSVENFLQYVNDGFYENTVFHRVIDGFMVQGGGFEPGMKQKTTRAPIRNEAENGLKNATISSTSAQPPRTATATACSGAWSGAAKWSTRSGVWPPAAAECTRTSRERTSSSRKRKP